MTEIIGVRFKSVGKVYYFSPDGGTFSAGDKVIVETARGVECGEVALANKMIPDEEIVAPLKPVIRKATEEDFAQIEKKPSARAGGVRDICKESRAVQARHAPCRCRVHV